jgi:cytochrome c
MQSLISTASRLASGMALLLMLVGSAHAQANKAQEKNSERGNPKLGFTLAKTYCARCHAIEKFGASPLAIAPPFRDLHLRYPVDDLAESLGEGIRTGHPSMPEFRFDPDQIENFIAYLKTLEH